MAFRDFPAHGHGVELLQRSLERSRLAHGYLFAGHQIEDLESLARTLAKTLNCQHPARSSGVAIDCCDRCLACRKIEHDNHADVRWVRPESKTRIITIDQVRELTQAINLKPTEAEYKVAMIVAADRLNPQAANAFLKTLEEPPARSILILLSTDPSRLIETILSRCLRINFGGDGRGRLDAATTEWLQAFSDLAASEQKSLLGRYRLLDVLLRKLTAMKAAIDETLSARSPLQRYEDVDKDLADKWEDELAAAIEAEYRRQRSDLLRIVQWWLRDVWLHTVPASQARQASACAQATGGLANPTELLSFPGIPGTAAVARRISSRGALLNLEILEQLQGRLNTNVQEALALEVSLLKLRL